MKFQKQLHWNFINEISSIFFSIKHVFNTSDQISLYVTTDTDYTNEKEITWTTFIKFTSRKEQFKGYPCR